MALSAGRCGSECVEYSDCLKKAKVKDSSDTERIYLALQAYNCDSGYIEWAIRNFGGYSKYNA